MPHWEKEVRSKLVSEGMTWWKIDAHIEKVRAALFPSSPKGQAVSQKQQTTSDISPEQAIQHGNIVFSNPGNWTEDMENWVKDQMSLQGKDLLSHLTKPRDTSTPPNEGDK